MNKIYIAGPMRGIKYYNFPAFDKAKQRLRAAGYEPVSPADLDREEGFSPWSLPEDFDWKTLPSTFDLRKTVQRDLQALVRCDSIFMLEGWSDSIGASAELAHAKWLGMDVYSCKQPPGIVEPAAVSTGCQLIGGGGEVRITDPTTGGAKGVKPERFDLIPVWPLEELARVYGTGEAKYPTGDDGIANWRRGYAWGYSFGAMMRHCWKFWRGEDLDTESGHHHLAHAAWHCFTLMTFGRSGTGTDDRTKGGS